MKMGNFEILRVLGKCMKKSFKWFELDRQKALVVTKIYTFATKTIISLCLFSNSTEEIRTKRSLGKRHKSICQKSKSPQALQRRLCPAFAVKWCLVTAKDRLFHQAQPALTWLDGIHVHRSFKSMEFSDSLSPVELMSILQILLQMSKANWLKWK